MKGNEYMILGMHKSGTTAVAEILMKSAFNLGFDLKPEEGDYKAEKGESRMVREINNIILGSHGKYSLNINEVDEINSDELEKVNLKIADFIKFQNAYGEWAIKDPRLILTFKFWRYHLPNCRCILVFRSPIDVVMRYIKSLSLLKKLLLFPFRTKKALKVWLIYNTKLIEIFNHIGPSNSLIINYESLMDTDYEIQRLENFIGRKLSEGRTSKHKQPDNFIDKAIRLYVLSFSNSYVKLYRELMELRSASIILTK